MQTECSVAANPQSTPTDLSYESADKWLLPSTSTIAICYYYSARKLIQLITRVSVVIDVVFCQASEDVAALPHIPKMTIRFGGQSSTPSVSETAPGKLKL